MINNRLLTLIYQSTPALAVMLVKNLFLYFEYVLLIQSFDGHVTDVCGYIPTLYIAMKQDISLYFLYCIYLLHLRAYNSITSPSKNILKRYKSA